MGISNYIAKTDGNDWITVNVISLKQRLLRPTRFWYPICERSMLSSNIVR